MPEEQVGYGPASQENPETDSFATKNDSLAEALPKSVEQEPVQKEKSGKYEKLLQSVSSVSPTTLATHEVKQDSRHVQTLEGEEEKIDHLVKLAHSKGLAHAVHVAEGLKDYYALDVFHDSIVDSLYDSLVKEGLITKE